MKILRNPMTLLALLAVLGAAALLSACGGGGSSESSTSSAARTVDQAFVAEMIPHHELAVEMAEMAQEQGQHPQVTQLADNIIETQSAEIEEMEPIAEEIGADPGSAGEGSSMSADASVLGLKMDEMGMSMDMSALDGAKPFDRAFIDMMVPHHEGAISMAKAELAKGEDSRLQDLAKRIITAQTKEIGEMNEWREEWYGAPVPPGATGES